MNYDMFESFTAFSKNLTKPMAQFQALTTKVAEKVTQQQFHMANDLLNMGVKHMQNLTTSKEPKDFMALQNSFLTESTHKCMENMSTLLSTTMQVSTECNKLFNESLKDFTEEVSRTKGGKAAAA